MGMYCKSLAPANSLTGVLAVKGIDIINLSNIYAMNYYEIKNRQPVLFECFFAFSNDQFKEGIAANNLDGKKILRAAGGLFGTQEGIQKLYDDYDAIHSEISQKCDPQEVYDYEFDNHECSYTNDDTEAIKIAASYFTDEQAKTIKRRHAYVKIEELDYSK